MENDLELQRILLGIWESPIMTLEFDVMDDQQSGLGKISSAGNERTMPFEFRLDLQQAEPALIITTPMTGAMTYCIRNWNEETLTLVKEGYSSETMFRKRSTE